MRHWGFCLILITVVKKSRDYGPRGKSLLYYIPHIPDIPHIPHIPHIPDIPHIPELFDLGNFQVVVAAVCRLKPVFSGFFLGGVFGTFFWVGFLAQHGPEPPSPILLVAAMLDDRTFCFFIQHGRHAIVFLYLLGMVANQELRALECHVGRFHNKISEHGT